MAFCYGSPSYITQVSQNNSWAQLGRDISFLLHPASTGVTQILEAQSSQGSIHDLSATWGLENWGSWDISLSFYDLFMWAFQPSLVALAKLLFLS